MTHATHDFRATPVAPCTLFARVAPLALLALFALFALSACSVDGAKIRSPHWDKDGCARCRMAISEPAAAAQLVLASGVARHYDDLGCLVEDRAAKPELAAATPYVLQSGSTTEWVKAKQVRFISGAKTPMGFGLVASPTGKLTFEQATEAITQRGGHRGHSDRGEP